MKNILAVFANPSGTATLRLGAEQRAIRECIRRSRFRDELRLTTCQATTIDDIRRALLDDDFNIVHFSGHGTRAGLVFEDESGAQYVPPMDAVAALLTQYTPPLECVLLNACYSVDQGRFTSMGLPFTIAMEDPISDAAAIGFSAAFYDSIGAGKDIPFSFAQGVIQLRLASSREYDTPVLLKRGETTGTTASAGPAQPTRSGKPLSGESPRDIALIGLALDVSGSMEDSFDNQDRDARTRLEAVRRSLSRFADAEHRQPDNTGSGALIFAYAFGLRSGAVGDLFSLLKAADDVMTPAEARALGKKHEAELRAQYSGSGFDDLFGLAKSIGLGDLTERAESLGRHEVKQRVAAEIQQRLDQRLRSLGDTTLGLDEFATFWNASGSQLAEAEPLIFGNTPMLAVMIEVRDRFARELRRLSSTPVHPLLLLVSDGEPTDGDPEPIAAEIRDMGVTIVSCYLTNFDLASPRRLRAAPDPDWPEGAARLFRMASPLADDSPLSRRLLKEGWVIERGAACFVQVNHSETLEGFIQALPSARPGMAEPLPKGR
jgi:hypothetical protein